MEVTKRYEPQNPGYMTLSEFWSKKKKFFLLHTDSVVVYKLLLDVGSLKHLW